MTKETIANLSLGKQLEIKGGASELFTHYLTNCDGTACGTCEETKIAVTQYTPCQTAQSCVVFCNTQACP